MSRRANSGANYSSSAGTSNGNATRAAGAANSGPPSHPAEHRPEHRAFLMRSLDRNDADLAAVLELNTQLEALRGAIAARCGELTLLNLGEGRLVLQPSPDDEENGGGGDGLPRLSAPRDEADLPQDPAHRRLCEDFLVRLKLRRRLLNRLSRRLLRAASAMDGGDVAPPGPPRYGDLRLHLDPSDVRASGQLRERQDRAVRALHLRREGKRAGQVELELQQDGDGEAPPSDSPAPEEAKEEPTEAESGRPRVEDGTEEPSAVATASRVETTEEEETGAAGLQTPDYGALRSYDDGYERLVDPATGARVRYAALDRPVEEDWSKIRFGAGIGAAHRSMSARDRELEFERWRTALLGRIPDQPTFAEVGTEHRVFDIDERRKRALDDEAEKKDEDNGAALLHGGAEDDEASDDDERFFDAEAGEDRGSEDEAPGGGGSDVEMADEADKKTPKEGGGGAGGGGEGGDAMADEENPDSNKKPEKGDDDKDVAEGKKAEGGDADPAAKAPAAAAAALRKVKPISLAAVPSFYDQDLKRIKLIHQELVLASAHETARRRMEEVTHAYNAALRRSVELCNRRDNCEAQLQKLHYQARTVDPTITAAENWMRSKLQYENDELNRLLKSRWGHPPDGTTVTKMYGRRPETVSKHVAHCLADVVDAVEMVSTGQALPMRPYPIPFPHGGSHFEALQNIEAQIRKDMNMASAKLRANEEDRLKAWRRMLKTKAECETPYHQSSRGRVQVTIHNYHTVPMPTLRTSGLENVSDEFAAPRPSVASYVPQRSRPAVPPPSFAAAPDHAHAQPDAHEAHPGASASSASRHPSESRYSTARVKERIAHDGTVAPVSEPKKSRDGLYLRPAGRTRKGMEWDAVRGIWVPSSSFSGNQSAGE